MLPYDRSMQVDTSLARRQSVSPALASSSLNGYSFPHAPSMSTSSSSNASVYSPASSVFDPPPPFHHFTYSDGRGGEAHISVDQPRSMSLSGNEGGDEGEGYGSLDMSEGTMRYSDVRRGSSATRFVDHRTAGLELTAYHLPQPSHQHRYSMLYAPSPVQAATLALAPAPSPSYASDYRFGGAPPPPPHPRHPHYPSHHQQVARYVHPSAQHDYTIQPRLYTVEDVDDCDVCLAEETERHRAIVNTAAMAVASSDPHLYNTSRPYTPQPHPVDRSSCPDPATRYHFGSLRIPQDHEPSVGGFVDAETTSRSEGGRYRTQSESDYRSPSSTESGSFDVNSTSGPVPHNRSSTTSAARARRAANRGVNGNVFRPSPQAMVAPGALPSAGSLSSKGREAPFPGIDRPGLPTAEDYAKMPTRRSRGRQPPSAEALLGEIAEGCDIDVSEIQSTYAGTTKGGKIKKIFLCKVSSAHLPRDFAELIFRFQ